MKQHRQFNNYDKNESSVIRITRLEIGQENIFKILDEIKTELKEMRTEIKTDIKELRKDMDAGFDKVDLRFEKVDRQLRGLFFLGLGAFGTVFTLIANLHGWIKV